jgi:mono/diheme cytochrome c family protein
LNGKFPKALKEHSMKLFKVTSLLFVMIFVSLLSVGAAFQGDKKENGKKEDVKGDAAKGKEVFEANCAICHEVTDQDKVGPGLKGISKKGPHKLSDGTEHKDHSPAVLRKQIVEGGGAMPPVGAALSDQEVADVIAYLQTL